MTAYCTYCSALKSSTKGKVPAIERYKSNRIIAVEKIAKEDGQSFFILSGKLGLLKPSSPIPYYDHLLTTSEIELHSEKIAAQFQLFQITNLVFFARPLSEDPNIKPYLDCIKLACEKALVSLTFAKISTDR